ncbi:MAG TPA: MTH865 family protein [Methanospirillum sp.]|jgi:hypothetical protein|uniref:MTH865 family protein n=1 Tax=Methanospirillum sp. TaxID=45200 RepID=UPI001BD2FFAC|nr:MTH865 family protein [Methanospirillum sp.]HPY60988.1 MTH865 family protein [Methanospirillum sp.]
MKMRNELFAKWVAAMKEVKFPVLTVDEVFSGLPKGSDSNISVGGLVVCNTGDLFSRFIKPTDFPIESAEALATLILDRAGL